jgi:3-methylcrotonyl-CoA carboxylase alpha subunit
MARSNKSLRSVLIANRGEIACRIIEAAQARGLRAIAVYSDADASGRHVRLADEAHHIGGAEARDSYLNVDAVLNAAKWAKADAIHPGYGFLSENADFAERCAAAGIVFIGPPAAAIRAMGEKDKAKAIMTKAGVPVVPGYAGAEQSQAKLGRRADKIGYPLLIKAVAGGGGRGMRLVAAPGDFAEALTSAKREAKGAFGNDRVLLEKFITEPRHIELQVFGDSHGQVVHLFERDCTAQRRHQKVVEEAPAPGMTQGLRAKMGEAAVAAAKAVDYVGAGTVEFIVPGSAALSDETPFYFMEMNTRLQVEHPVTELVTGQDLVDWQLQVAAGAPLPLSQDQIALDGHAMEARLYAEDPAAGFLPQTGRLGRVIWPEGPEIRVDRGVDQGDEISPYYDPMIAKIIAGGRNRQDALQTLQTALGALRVAGLRTNAGFLSNLLADRSFVSGRFSTGLIDQAGGELLGDARARDKRAAACLAWLLAARGETRGVAAAAAADPFAVLTAWSLSAYRQTFELTINGETDTVGFGFESGEVVAVDMDGLRFAVAVYRGDGGQLRIEFPVGPIEPLYAETSNGIVADCGGASFEVTRARHDGAEADMADGAEIIRSPMPGKMHVIRVKAGDRVKKGARLGVLEAMKMEHALTAAHDAVVAEVRAAQGEQVNEGDILFILESLDEDN